MHTQRKIHKSIDRRPICYYLAIFLQFLPDIPPPPLHGIKWLVLLYYLKAHNLLCFINRDRFMLQ